MPSTVAVVVGAVAAYFAYTFVAGLRKNIALAKKTGLRYVVTPCSPYLIWWQLTHKFWVPLIQKLPRSWWEDWLEVMLPDWYYHRLHAPFARLGETFAIASPTRLLVVTDSAEAIHQITQQREKFPKEVEAYSILRQFGNNVLTSEGVVWRLHRKVTSASFNERNACLVFIEAIKQSQGMVKKWLGQDGKGRETIRTVDHDTMRFALNIIGYVGFGLRLLWPGETLPPNTEPRLVKYSSLDAPEGHTMSFVDSIAEMLEHILILLMLPRWLLRILPFQYTKIAADSHANYVKYMDELVDDKIAEIRRGDHGDPGMDLMGQLVRNKYGKTVGDGASDKNGTAGTGAGGAGGKAKSGKEAGGFELSRSDIIGNAFIMLVAGHETTANAMHFSLVELACNPLAQRRMQADVDRLFGKSDPRTWDYDSKVSPMLASMLGAVMNETLRMMPAVVGIPKKVNPAADGILTLEGEKHVIPAGTSIALVAVCAHYNPRYWPTRPSRITSGTDDLGDFVPERWFRASKQGDGAEEVEGGDTEDYGGFQGPDTSAEMFRPRRGAYIPFSDGARSCLGRRIAQVEIIAALAVIFQHHSLELAVDEWATDDEVARMGRPERSTLYKKAQESCRSKLREARSVLTLKLHGTHVPIRIVPRGQERFVSFVDEELAV